MPEFRKAAAGARRAGRMLATEPSILDGRAGDLPAGPLSVELDDVLVTTTSTGQPVLHDLDLRLEPGTVARRAGPHRQRQDQPRPAARSGSGTPTSAPSASAAWTCATPPSDLRRRVGVVTQEVELLRASVRDNLTLFDTVAGRRRRSAEVLDDVGLGLWLAGLPDGLDTELAGSDALSAGEAQLLAFARVLLADPGLVVLDEASSRLDPDTEARVTPPPSGCWPAAPSSSSPTASPPSTGPTRSWCSTTAAWSSTAPAPTLAADPDSRYRRAARRRRSRRGTRSKRRRRWRDGSTPSRSAGDGGRARRPSSARVAWRLLRCDPAPTAIWLGWVAFFMIPSRSAC